MGTFHFIIYFVLTVPIMFGQSDSLFKVQVGTFKCSPNFKLQDSATLSFINSMGAVYEYYDEKIKKYVTKEGPIEPQDNILTPSGSINPVTFHFPKRIDSVLTIRSDPDSTGKVHETILYEKNVSDNYEFMNVQDSICSSQLNKFWQSNIEIYNSSKKQKFKSCYISILYSDGMFFNTIIENSAPLKNNELTIRLNNSFRILAFSISDILFKADDKKEYIIGQGFAWKVINCY